MHVVLIYLNFGRIDLTVDNSYTHNVHAYVHIYRSFYRNLTSCKLRQKIAVARVCPMKRPHFTVARTYVSHAITREQSIGTGATTEAVALCHYSRHIKHLLCLTLHLPRVSFVSRVRCNMRPRQSDHIEYHSHELHI